MATVTKKELVDRIANRYDISRLVVRRVVQGFLDEIVEELERENRLEFRDFGVFEAHYRPPRIGQNPATLQPVTVPGRRRVRFKAGRMLKKRLAHAAKKMAENAAPPAQPAATTESQRPAGESDGTP